MEKVGSHEARTNLSKLLDKVAQGQRITVTKQGVPVAVLVPACAQEKADPKEVILEIRALRRKVSLRGLSLRKMITEGRRF